MQTALEIVEPWGERRNDERGSRYVAEILLALSQTDSIPMQEVIAALMKYLPFLNKEDEI